MTDPTDLSNMTRCTFFGQAAVLDRDLGRDEGEYRVTMMSRTCRARSALGPEQSLSSGDIVLIAGNDMAHLYIIGLLQSGSDNHFLALEDGTRAVRSAAGKSLQVMSGQGELLFEYDAAGKTTRINIQEGDLKITNPHGRIDFQAGGGIGMASEGSVEIRAQGRILLFAQKLESIVETVLEKARDIYRSAEKLTQIRTGRMRTMVEQTCHLKTKKAFYKAEKDFKIKGDKIHLG